MRVETNGTVVVATGLTTQGQGHPDRLRPGRGRRRPSGSRWSGSRWSPGTPAASSTRVGTFASRAAVMSGNAVTLAAGKVRAKALRIAAEALEADPDDLEVPTATVQESRRAPDARDRPGPPWPCWPTRCATPSTSRPGWPPSSWSGRGDDPPVAEGDEPGLEATDWYSPVRSTFANGIHAAVVETDPETAEVTDPALLRGARLRALINPRIVEGQIHGGVAQGVGGALYERLVYDENGQLLNALVHGLPDAVRTPRSPRVEIDHLETPSPLNPLGIKGAGEAGTIPGRPCWPRPSPTPRVLHRPHADLPSELWALRERHARKEEG